MSAYSDLILAESGLVAYWRMDDTSGSTLTDAFSTNDGSILASVGLDQASLLTNDPDNPAMDFTGADSSSCTVPSLGDGFTGITWEAWCKPETVPADDTFRTVMMGRTGSPTAQYIQMDGDGFEVSVRTNAGQNTRTDAATNVFTAGVTVHVAFTWSAADPNIRFFKNGVATGSPLAQSGATISNTTTGSIGANNTTDSKFDGIIDEVALYNRALSASELLAHYDQGVASATVFQYARPDADVSGSWTPSTGADVFAVVSDSDDGTYATDTLA